MIPIFVRNGTVLHEQGDENNIIYRREIMPLLAKARQVVRHYEKAVGCFAAVLDSSGGEVKTPGSPAETCQNDLSPFPGKKQMLLCEFCINHFQESSQACRGNEYPCVKMHRAALIESRRIEGAYVYDCAAGFVFWTSPLFRSGRYAGALIAGQVILGRGEHSYLRGLDLPSGRGAVLEKINALCTNKIAAQKFSAMIENVPEKRCEEIRALAEMLGICVEEISERREDPSEMIRRKSWQSVSQKSSIETFKSGAKKEAFSRGAAALEYAPEGSFASVLSKTGNEERRPRRGFLEKERMLLAAFRRGDNETGGKILKELMNCLLAVMPGNMDIIRFRAIELMVLLSRAAISEPSSRGEQGTAAPARTPDGSDAILEINNRYLGRMLESKTAEELIENLHLGSERMAGKIFSFQGMRHASALRRAERYIWENYTRKLSLEEIARASGLSAPYFSTIFKEEMGENLSSYLNRLRIERTVTLLTETGKSLNEIAKLCGFEDQSWFSKIFKNFTGISPGKFRENGGGAVEIKNGKDRGKSEILFRPMAGDQSRWLMNEWDEQEILSS